MAIGVVVRNASLAFLIALLALSTRETQAKSVVETCSSSEFNRHVRAAGGSAAFVESLYLPDDPIAQLNNTNFADVVFGKTPAKAHYVEFYYSWCGHCRNFAPTYQKFAKDVKGWSDVVSVAAMNCALEANREVCELNNIERVPHIKYFPATATTYDDAEIVPVYRTIGNLRHDLVDLIVEEQRTNKHGFWPSFEFLSNSTNASQLFDGATDDIKSAMFIFERDLNNYTGVELVLDFFGHNRDITVKRVKDDHPLNEEWAVVAYPSVVIVERETNEPQLLESRRALFMGVLSEFADLPYWDSSNDTASTGKFGDNLQRSTTMTPPSFFTESEPGSIKDKYYVSETDLLLGLSFALRNEVTANRRVIAGSNFTDLSNFIDMLRRYFPQSNEVKEKMQSLGLPPSESLPRSERARAFFSDLHSYLVSKNDSSSITVEEWRTKFQELEREHNFPFPSANNTDWQHCRGSDPKYRGYTCSLWSLFHTLTVNAHLQDVEKPNFDPLELLRAIKGFVKTYFGCTYCSEHFVEMVTKKLKMEDLVKVPSDGVMYLWRAHNTVNLRLAGDTTEDPDFPKQQFPADFLCHDCKDASGEWNDNNVLKYLLQYYTSIHV